MPPPESWGGAAITGGVESSQHAASQQPLCSVMEEAESATLALANYVEEGDSSPAAIFAPHLPATTPSGTEGGRGRSLCST